MTETRRHALKMLGAIGATCAFPFAGDELYGQHVHTTLAQVPAPGPYTPAFFTPAEYARLLRLTDVIIPPTDTPGASAAGVPEYIDRVVTLNAEHQPLIRAGLAWLEQQSKDRFSREFLSLGATEHIAILQPLSDEIDRQQRDVQRRRFRSEGVAAVGIATRPGATNRARLSTWPSVWSLSRPEPSQMILLKPRSSLSRRSTSQPPRGNGR